MARTWEAPAAPTDVSAVDDDHEVRWTRDPSGDFWWGDIGHGYEVHKTWFELLARGRLTEAA